MDLSEVIIKFANEVSVSGWRLLFSLSSLIGILYGMTTLMRYAHESSIPGHQPNMSALLVKLIICAMLVQMSAVISATSHTFLAAEVSYGPISYATADTGRLGDSIDAALTIASLAGGIFFLRGLISLKRASLDGQVSYRSDDTVMKAIVQMCFGAFLVQIDDMMDVVQTSLNLYW